MKKLLFTLCALIIALPAPAQQATAPAQATPTIPASLAPDDALQVKLDQLTEENTKLARDLKIQQDAMDKLEADRTSTALDLAKIKAERETATQYCGGIAKGDLDGVFGWTLATVIASGTAAGTSVASVVSTIKNWPKNSLSDQAKTSGGAKVVTFADGSTLTGATAANIGLTIAATAAQGFAIGSSAAASAAIGRVERSVGDCKSSFGAWY